jgi:citrate lyase subunit beta/citryl-CoA lyase
MSDTPDPAIVRPRRSVLYLPAANERAVEKAATLPADALILDLEDAVAPEAKADARDRAVAAVLSGRYGPREVTIRCNGLDTPWGADDLAAIAGSGAAGVVIPKVDSVATLDAVSDHLDRAGAPPSMTLWPMIETPTAVLDARLLAAHPRVAVLVVGTNDLAKELGAVPGPDREPIVASLSLILLAARAAGRTVLDGVYNDIGNLDGLLRECHQGRALGFDGKTLIHPGQIEATNDVWSPDDDEVTQARRIIDAFTEAEADGRGVVTVDGRMVEHLHVIQARRTIAVAEAIAALG